MKPTKAQQLAIDIRDANVLVSAAAGSGKTSVLVTRVVERIIAPKDPVDVDRLLIMTFTNAAAEEMRTRIRDAIDSRINEMRRSPDRDEDMLANLEKQSLLVHNAMITTIHGFCKSVITDHYEDVSLDPTFRVADENECKLIRRDALYECLEKAYEKADPAFLAAARCFSVAKNDSGLADLIIPIYNFVIADPDPEGFMNECRKLYDYASFEIFSASDLVRRFEEFVISETDKMRAEADEALEIIADHEEITPYKAAIEGYKDVFDALDTRLSGAKDAKYDVLREVLRAASVPAFGSIRAKGLDDETIAAKNRVRDIRDDIKSGISKLVGMMPFDLKTSYNNVTAAKPVLAAVIDTVSEFSRIYDAKKRDKNVIDFNDMEHMAVKILRDPDIAASYRQQYVEIYVDEYQDSNMTQEVLVSLICRKDPGNVFQVGDVKQSIYRFRQARPDLFLSKYDTYGDDDPVNRRILLKDNFRSRTEVVDAVNEVFSVIMRRDLGGIEYDDDAKLCASATCYDDCTHEKGNYKTELIVGTRDELSAEEFEANYIAGRIREMIDEGFMIFDKKKEIMRPISYRDFTILVRSIKSFEPVFRRIFAATHIPLAVSGREGYFDTVEVQTALSFLAAVDNPLNDIPLTALMRSQAGGFSDKDLAELTAGTIEEVSRSCMYDRVRKMADNNDKCKAFLDMIKTYREKANYTPVHTLLSEFIDREYIDHVRCMNNADQRIANLSMLLAKAEDYGKTSFKGLYQFNRYMEQIRKYEIDDGEASILSESDDVVRIMTMHSSKGLEFPVCFVAGMEKRRNNRDESGKIIWNTKNGFGLDFTDLDRRITGTTLPKEMIREANRRESIAEEMRILYVAMTRAREKLIMVGCGKEGLLEEGSKTPENCSSYLDMVLSAKGYDGFEHIGSVYISEKELVKTRLDKELRTESVRQELAEAATGAQSNKNTSEKTPECLKPAAIPYPHDIHPDLKAKLSVSELKHRAIEEKLANGEVLSDRGEELFRETEPEKYIPKFMRAEGETKTGGTFYGTAFHRIMELWEYPKDMNNNTCNITCDMVVDFADRMHQSHHMDAEMVAAIKCDDVAFFLNSQLGRKMASANAAGSLYREQPFVIGVPDRGETVLVQGIIDAYFIEDDGITIVDYKTDHVSSEDILINRYRAQLEYYGKALSQITGQRIKALTIYSTHLRKEIVIA